MAKTSKLLDVLSERVVLADGAMGTEIYSRGVFVNRCFDELNLSKPDLVTQIHEEYLKAGAELIETNTFGANRFKLEPHGLGDRVTDINRRAVEIARQASRGKAFVAASVGPTGAAIEPIGRIAATDVRRAFEEQIQALADAKPDVIILETFFNLNELKLAYDAARAVCDLPVIAQPSFTLSEGGDFAGLTPENAVQEIQAWGADVIGTNCGSGPAGTFSILERMRPLCDRPMSAMPNAGVPENVQGRTLYMATPEFMGTWARRLVKAGVRLIGGCCGTTPAMIQTMGEFLKSVQPSPKTKFFVDSLDIAENKKAQQIAPTPTAQKSKFAALLGKKFAVSVELDPPRGVSAEALLDSAKLLADNGVDAINIADGPRATARMSPTALASLLKANVGIETIVHYCCRDRNILGMQADLIGAHATGLRNILIITGDPPKLGNYPHATAVFDVDSIGLIRLANLLNRGLDLAGEPLGGKTELLIGTGCNPGAIDADLELQRLQKKIEAGAEYVFSQPVYDPETLERFLKRAKPFLKIPFFVGILPLASLRNAEFLHSEIPGMQIPPAVMQRMAAVSTKEAQKSEGIAIAREALQAARTISAVKGAYIMPPFNQAKTALAVLSGLS